MGRSDDGLKEEGEERKNSTDVNIQVLSFRSWQVLLKIRQKSSGAATKGRGLQAVSCSGGSGILAS